MRLRKRFGLRGQDRFTSSAVSLTFGAVSRRQLVRVGLELGLLSEAPLATHADALAVQLEDRLDDEPALRRILRRGHNDRRPATNGELSGHGFVGSVFGQHDSV